MKSNDALASSIKTGLRVLSRTIGSTCEMALINLVVVGTKNLCRSTKRESSAISKVNEKGCVISNEIVPLKADIEKFKHIKRKCYFSIEDKYDY